MAGGIKKAKNEKFSSLAQNTATNFMRVAGRLGGQIPNNSEFTLTYSTGLQLPQTEPESADVRRCRHWRFSPGGEISEAARRDKSGTNENTSFVPDTAERTGRTGHSIQQAVHRASNISSVGLRTKSRRSQSMPARKSARPDAASSRPPAAPTVSSVPGSRDRIPKNHRR